MKTTWALWEHCNPGARSALLAEIHRILPPGASLESEEPVGLDAEGLPVYDKYARPVYAVWFAS